MLKTMLKTLAALGLALIAPAVLRAQAQSAVTGGAAMARVIVKYKADSSLLRKQAQSAAQQHAEQAVALGARIGVALATGRGVAERTQVVFARGMSSEALAARVAREADIEYAVPDRFKRRNAVPNDPLFAAGGANGPAVGQWYLKAPAGAAQASINAVSAWDVSTGNVGIVVAVLDTGVRFDHPDLKKVQDGGNFLDGYDMIHDVATANDGTGRDADASDPGDWVSQADIDGGTLGPGCTAADISNSSWHGTQTAGLIGALTDNSVGMASVGRNVRILPVRVLGKCGGFDSDIIAGMRWAVGLSTGDNLGAVPSNTNPARVINLSLGGTGSCSQAYTDAVAAVTTAGAVVVASAGNSSGHAVSEPANCAGVIGVAGLRHTGTKVGYSDIGPEVSIAAPAGNCVNSSGTCLFPILTTSNSGTTAPVSGASGATYTGSGSDASIGTSFSAPLVAGTAALMFSVRPNLSPLQVKQLIQASARSFPSGAVAECTAPQYDAAGAPVDQGDECACSTGTCGSGMLDAGAAVLAATSATLTLNSRARIDVPAKALLATQPLQLDGSRSEAASGRSITAYQWSVVDGGGIVTSVAGATGAVASVTPTAPGRFKVRLTVTDSSAATSTTDLSVVVLAAPVTGPSSSSSSGGGGGGGALGAGWLMLLLSAVLALAPRRVLRQARTRR